MPGILISGIIVLLIIWLIHRIKNRIRLIVSNEIYKNFPAIKNSIDSFEHRMNYLKTQIELLEHKITELENKTKK